MLQPGLQPGPGLHPEQPQHHSLLLATFMYRLGSWGFEVVQTALRNLPEYTLLCPGLPAVLGMNGQVDTSAQTSEAPRLLRMEAVMRACHS